MAVYGRGELRKALAAAQQSRDGNRMRRIDGKEAETMRHATTAAPQGGLLKTSPSRGALFFSRVDQLAKSAEPYSMAGGSVFRP